MTEIKKTPIQEAASQMGKRGSAALIKKRGKKYMQKLAKLGGRARWVNHKKVVK